jgi:hypothetical protein
MFRDLAPCSSIRVCQEQSPPVDPAKGRLSLPSRSNPHPDPLSITRLQTSCLCGPFHPIRCFDWPTPWAILLLTPQSPSTSQLLTSNLSMERVCFSKMLASAYETTWHQTAKQHRYHTRRRGNFKSQIIPGSLNKYFSFKIVFWDVLPCKITVDRRFRGTCCLHHQGWTGVKELGLSLPSSATVKVRPDVGGSTYHWNVGRQLF